MCDIFFNAFKDGNLNPTHNKGLPLRIDFVTRF